MKNCANAKTEKEQYYYTTIGDILGDKYLKELQYNLKERVDNTAVKKENSYFLFRNGIDLLYYSGCEKDALILFEKAADYGHKSALIYCNALSGDIEAQKKLAKKYDVGCEQNTRRMAFFWYEKLAAQGNSEAQFKLGWFYEKGIGVIKNYNDAMKWYSLSSENDNKEASFRLGIEFEKVDLEKAIKYYSKSGIKGKDRLERCYYELGVKFEKVDLEKSINYFLKSGKLSKERLRECYYKLGEIYEFNICKKNIKKALYYYNISAQAGDMKAQKRIRQEREKELLMHNADLSNADVQFRLGKIFENERNLEQVLNWYCKSAKQGNSDAQFCLGLYYFEWEQNVEKAIVQFKKSMEQGNNVARIYYETLTGSPIKQYEMAMKYMREAIVLFFPNGVDISHHSGLHNIIARKLLRRSAESGCSEAQFEYAECWWEGKGGEYNPKEAYKWYVESEKNGCIKAKEAIKKHSFPWTYWDDYLNSTTKVIESSGYDAELKFDGAIDTKNMPYIARENGMYGSIPKSDDYSDESGPEVFEPDY